MALTITITPAGDGWVLRTDALASEQFFNSGGRAEDAARRLAERFAGFGSDTQLEITLRDGALAGRLHYTARPQS